MICLSFFMLNSSRVHLDSSSSPCIFLVRHKCSNYAFPSHYIRRIGLGAEIWSRLKIWRKTGPKEPFYVFFCILLLLGLNPYSYFEYFSLDFSKGTKINGSKTWNKRVHIQVQMERNQIWTQLSRSLRLTFSYLIVIICRIFSFVLGLKLQILARNNLVITIYVNQSDLNNLKQISQISIRL